MTLEKRSVTSSLIFRFPNDDESRRPQLALFQRSDKVRTYQGKYGLISGSIEASDASPLACAWRELREETSLTSPALELLRHGRPFTFQDASVGREWTVFPFLFKLAEARAADIAIDWEHVGYTWVDPEGHSSDKDHGDDGDRLAGLECVPRLTQSLRSVWFEMDLGPRAGSILAEGLRELRSDFVSGAREMAARAAGIYGSTLEALAEVNGSDREAWWRRARLAGWHLWKNGRESMGASIANLVLGVLAAVEGSFRDAESLAGCVHGAVEQVSRTGEDSGRRIRESFRTILQELVAREEEADKESEKEEEEKEVRILTLSSSSTVTACLIDALSAAGGHTLDIRVLESRPLFEGVRTARGLAAHAARHSRSRVTVYTDASAAIAARDAHLVLLGADAIDGSASVSNKTGSLPAVLAARHVAPGVRVVVVSETGKVVPFGERPGEERSNVEEMTRSWGAASLSALKVSEVSLLSSKGKAFAVENILFEWVDADLVDAFVTERGVLTPAEMVQQAEEMRRGADRFFVDI